METQQPLDLIGIGIGPFNLGLAVLSKELPLSALMFDQATDFNWHPGLLLDHSGLQVPFYADLVTLVDPCNSFSFLSYLQSRDRLLRFAILENNQISRKEYNDYCRWATRRLSNLRFQQRISRIDFDKKTGMYLVETIRQGDGDKTVWPARHLVLGVGTVPYLPKCAAGISDDLVFHSGNYLFKKENLLKKGHITIIGSGQSAAEIFFDLLPHSVQMPGGLHWYTRSQMIFSMERSRMCFEMSSPDYIDYFFQLSREQKDRLLPTQDNLYKGINEKLIADIYDLMYRLDLSHHPLQVAVRPGCELLSLSSQNGQVFTLEFLHTSLKRRFTHCTEAVIFATGYRSVTPGFTDGIRSRLCLDEMGRYAVNRNYSVDITGKAIFVQNAELHTHGFNAPDLALGPYRNACILNSILGYPHFKMNTPNIFQSFGMPGEPLKPDGLVAGMQAEFLPIPDKLPPQSGR